MSAAAPSLTPEALPAVTVPSGADDRLQLAERFEAGRARMLVRVDDDRVALALRDSTATISAARRPLACAAAAFSWLRSAKASWSSRLIWKSCGDILGRARHGVVAIGRLHLRIDEAPADGGVVHLGIAVEGAGRLGHDEGRAAHAFAAAGDDQVGLAAADRPRRHRHRIEARAAQAVERDAARAVGQARRAGPPCARGCDCPRPPGWRSRG